MTKRYNKPGRTKHVAIDKSLLNLVVEQEIRENGATNCKCLTCGKVVYRDIPEAQRAADAYNATFKLIGATNRKIPYECRTSPGCFHFGAPFTPPTMVEAFRPPPVIHVPVQQQCTIIEPAPMPVRVPEVMDEINLNGVVYIKKELVPLPPKILGTVNMAGVMYNIVKR
jgi:hypothetical protein